jgi:hypothetical protein
VSAHSPAPWRGDDFDLIVSSIQRDPKKFRIEQATITDDSGNEICRIVHDPDDGFDLVADRAVHEANARLIAAAPDMLRELKSILEWAVYEHSPLMPAEIASIKATIAKAEGRS